MANSVKESIKEEIEIDYPDEFLDPLLATPMFDPVKLPSGLVMDRSAISTHLLSKNTDPFTNLPLYESDLIPDLEMKAKIDAFTEEALRKARSE